MANRTSGTSSGGGNPTVLSSSGVGHQVGSGSTLDAGAAANVYTNLRKGTMIIEEAKLEYFFYRQTFI